MSISNGLLSYLRTAAGHTSPACKRLLNLHQLRRRPDPPSIAPPFRTKRSYSARYDNVSADDPNFISLVDQPQQLVSTKKKHGPGLIVLAIIPITAFALGTWQVQRLAWKTDLIARFEDRLVRDPLPLPPHIEPSVVHEFDYRRVYATGRFRHDQEILIGPRVHEGEDGYIVITPLERKDASKILVSRGWIAKSKALHQDRPDGLPEQQVTVKGLLREPFKNNMFTPENVPEKGQWYFPQVDQMAQVTGSQPVWMEETMVPDLKEALFRRDKGIPIGRIAEVNLRNNHTQYIFTWYALSFATSIMFYMVARKQPSAMARRVRHSREW